MTVIMALRHSGQIWISSDTRITEGDFKVDFSNNDKMDSKLLHLENAIIGAAGDLSLRNYMELFVSRLKGGAFKFESKLAVIEFFIAFKKFLKREGPSDSGTMHTQGNATDASWLVATATQIFVVDQDGAVLEYPVMAVIGSGTDTARAVLEYVLKYQPTLNVPSMLFRAHEIAVQHNLSCGGKQVVINVTKRLKEAS